MLSGTPLPNLVQALLATLLTIVSTSLGRIDLKFSLPLNLMFILSAICLESLTPRPGLIPSLPIFALTWEVNSPLLKAALFPIK